RKRGGGQRRACSSAGKRRSAHSSERRAKRGSPSFPHRDVTPNHGSLARAKIFRAAGLSPWAAAFPPPAMIRPRTAKWNGVTARSRTPPGADICAISVLFARAALGDPPAACARTLFRAAPIFRLLVVPFA